MSFWSKLKGFFGFKEPLNLSQFSNEQLIEKSAELEEQATALRLQRKVIAQILRSRETPEEAK